MRLLPKTEDQFFKCMVWFLIGGGLLDWLYPPFDNALLPLWLLFCILCLCQKEVQP